MGNITAVEQISVESVRIANTMRNHVKDYDEPIDTVRNMVLHIDNLGRAMNSCNPRATNYILKQIHDWFLDLRCQTEQTRRTIRVVKQIIDKFEHETDSLCPYYGGCVVRPFRLHVRKYLWHIVMIFLLVMFLLALLYYKDTILVVITGLLNVVTIVKEVRDWLTKKSKLKT